MAKYFLNVKIFSRSRGSRVTKAAAYRAGERIHDDRTSESHNYSHRRDVVTAEIALPSQYAGRADMEWARNRSVLWNAAEHSDRRNARLAREVFVALPPELTTAQRCHLTRLFSQELADKYHCAVDFAVHLPREGSDERSHHAHILMTARQVTPAGLGARTTLELGGRERHARGLRPCIEELRFIRERWAQLSNEAFRNAGLATRIDHRSYKDQGIDGEPAAVIPRKIFYHEKKTGLRHPVGEEIRAKRRERMDARLKGSDELARVIARQKAEAREQIRSKARQAAAQPKKIRHGALTREERLQRRREYKNANREAINRKNREWQRANAAEINRKNREWRMARAARAMAKTSSEGKTLPPGKEQAARHNPGNDVPLERPPTAATADESVNQWLTYRGANASVTPDASIEHWLAYRVKQGQAQHSSAELPDRGVAPATQDTTESDREERSEDLNRGHRNDFGL